MSAYTDNLRKQEIDRFNQHQRERELDTLVSQFNGNVQALIKSDIPLSGNDISYLNRVYEAQALQSAHNAAFLAGFTGKGR